MADSTILVPTHNRPKMMKRFLDFMSHEKVRHKILIADSSDDSDCKSEMKKIVESVEGDLNISYLPFSGHTFHEKYLSALCSVYTDYVCTVADHNFLHIACLMECESFLDKNPDYSHVNGKIYTTSLRDKEINFSIYSQLPSEADDAAERVVGHLEAYTNNFYTVCRVSSLSGLRLAFEADIGRSLKERLANIIPLADGKRKVLDCDFLVRDKSSKKTGEDETGRRSIDGDPKDSSYIKDISYGFEEYIRLVKEALKNDRELEKNEMRAIENALIEQHESWKKKKISRRGFRKTIVSGLPEPLRRSIASARSYVATPSGQESGGVDESRSPFLANIRPYLTR